MTPIVFSKGVARFLCDTAKMDVLDGVIREMVDEMERADGHWFVPYPPSKEDEEQHKDKQVKVTFLPIDGSGRNTEVVKPNTPMVMILPFFIKDEGRNIWYVQMKDEGAKIELDYATQVLQGHQRTKGGGTM
jgi:hypothetical protein